MQGSLVHTLICAIITMDSVLCTETHVRYMNAASLEGSVFTQLATASVQGCVAMCDHHRPSCQGSRYNKGSKECHLLDKRSSVQTTTFYSDASWTIYIKVNKYLSVNMFLCITKLIKRFLTLIVQFVKYISSTV